MVEAKKLVGWKQLLAVQPEGHQDIADGEPDQLFAVTQETNWSGGRTPDRALETTTAVLGMYQTDFCQSSRTIVRRPNLPTARRVQSG